MTAPTLPVQISIRHSCMFRHGIHMRPKSAKPQCMQQNVLKGHGSHPTSKCRSFVEHRTSKLSRHMIASAVTVEIELSP